ncbi:MAG: hypothetical protein JWN24_4653 [Phycisphaerales bacterium]|nr:hypothetical protein [Phycisphaerales bacterium]
MRLSAMFPLQLHSQTAPGDGSVHPRPSDRHDSPTNTGAWAVTKDLLFWAYLHCGYVQARDAVLSLIGHSRAVVVYYHRIGCCDALGKPTNAFRSDLEYMKRHYACVSLAEMCRRLQGGRPLRRRSIAVTFDDGYRDNLTQALEPLLDAGVPATFFVATGFVGTTRQFPHDSHCSPALDHPKLTWPDLALMQSAGFEIGSHTVNHTNLGAADASTIHREMSDSLATLNRELGNRPRAFSFPWGKPVDIPCDAMNSARGIGYYAAASAFGGTNRRAASTFHVRRVDVGNGRLSRLAIRARIAGFDPDYLRLRIKTFFRRSGLLALFALTCIAPRPAAAATIYVSPDGADNRTGSSDQPVATPARALDLAVPGDTVLLHEGRYTIKHFLWMNKAGVSMASCPNETAVLSGPTSDEQGVPFIVCIAADKISLVNLEIRGGADYGIKVETAGDTDSIDGAQIRGCRVRDTGQDCIKTVNADHLLIEGCDIGPSGVRDPSNAEGIDSVGSHGVAIRQCHVHDTTTNGIYLKGGTTDGLVECCRVERTGKFGGILLGQDTDERFMRDGVKYEAIRCIARNNIVTETGAAGLATYSGDNIRFENNTLVDVAREGQAGFWVVTNSRGVPARNVAFKNNIVVTSGQRPTVFIKDLADRLDCDCNLFFATHGTCKFIREAGKSGKTDDWSFEQWVAHTGTDTHSRAADPMLDAGRSYAPRAGSPAIGHGETIAALKDDFAGRSRPAGAAPDIGALQHREPGHSEARP